MIEESNISRETAIYNLILIVERCMGRKPFKRIMWRSGKFIEVESINFTRGPCCAQLSCLARRSGCSKNAPKPRLI